mmetsp:Transcript_11494/g.23579  ORF Transcript_11494/g.23579 Transcript_11494/m.23579 type:complete len:202 (-) Transcript_11494:587-1192(-)
MRAKFEKMIREAQIKITQAIQDIDGKATFQEDAWVRENGGGGMSRVLCDGNVFEKAGVNLSVVYGSMPQEALQAATERGVDRAKGYKPGERVPFFACGLSSVMHPKNPHCPTMHFNYRYFETDGGGEFQFCCCCIDQFITEWIVIDRCLCKFCNFQAYLSLPFNASLLLSLVVRWRYRYYPLLHQRGRHEAFPRHIQGGMR